MIIITIIIIGIIIIVVITKTIPKRVTTTFSCPNKSKSH
jgi:hypothetical protein